MAEIIAATGTAVDAAAKIKKYVVTPIGDQLRFLFSFNSYIQDLRVQVEKLNQVREDLQRRVLVAERNRENISCDVRYWFGQVEEVNQTRNRICGSMAEVQRGCLYGWCPNLKLRYRLSREAKEAAAAAVQLSEAFPKFTRIAYTEPPEPIPLAADIVEFETRKSKEEEIMAALNDDKVYMIGVCGMGGVGKTAMVKKIAERIRESKLFEEVVMAVVSQSPDLGKVQQEIAEGLDLTFKKETLPGRATELHDRLKRATRVLIILDDVWAKMKLNELGIPSQRTHGGCKIIVTSRVPRVSIDMDPTAKIVHMEVLSEQEAWILFRVNAGDSIDAPDFHCIAKAVAKECKGLPLALITLGSALRDQIKSSWEDALLQLRNSIIPANIPEVLQDVYEPLKASYDKLHSNEARYLFLLCCLFPEDCIIPVETLIKYGKGLHILEGVETLGETRKRVYTLLEMLKSSFLLINGDYNDNEYVKMHDIIRDMAIFIASKGEHVFITAHRKSLGEWPQRDSYQEYTCISLSSDSAISLPENINCPKLDVLRMDFGGSLEIPENFFKEMTGLKVLEVHCPKYEMPTSLVLLTKLRVLNLRRCSIMTPSLIGKLENLEILNLAWTDLTVLPKEIARLKKLKSLDLTGCWRIEEIAAGVISELTQLEELFMSDSFTNWQAEEDGKERRNASLAELAPLTNLTTLEINIPDSTLIAKDLLIGQKLERYFMLIGIDHFNRGTIQGNPRKIIVIVLKAGSILGDWTYALARKAEYIYLQGDSGCTDEVGKLAQNAFDHWDSDRVSKTSTLKELFLHELDAVRRLWKSRSEYLWLSNLKRITIKRCKFLEFVLPLTAVESLSQLEELIIEECPVMEEVFKAEEERAAGGQIIGKKNIRFPKLREVYLEKLPGLKGFCKGIDGIEFPSLKILIISSSPRLSKLCSPADGSVIPEGDHNNEKELLFDKVSAPCLTALNLVNLEIAAGIFAKGIPTGDFSGLERLTVDGCGWRSVFYPSMFRGLTNLYCLALRNCSMLEEVIVEEDENKDSQTPIHETLFPKLAILQLQGLPKFRRFFNTTNGLELPSLKYLTIYDCPAMERFSLGSISLPSLEYVDGFSDPNLANKIFFNKEESDYKNNCFSVSAEDLSIIDGNFWEYLVLESSGHKFALFIQIYRGKNLEICGKFDAVKRLPEIEYEIAFMIMLEDYRYFGRPDFQVNLKLILPQGDTLCRTENLREKPRGEWIEILAREFTTGLNPNGDLDFALYPPNITVFGPLGNSPLRIRGVNTRPKV